MLKYINILLLLGIGYGVDCAAPYIINHTGEYCIPQNFYYQSSTLQAAYFFLSVSIEGNPVSSEDWVGAFNGNICVGARKWDTNECGGGVCEVPVLGYSDSSTQGYMLPNQIPTFKIFRHSDSSYLDAYPSENIPWFNFAVPVIDSLSIECTGIIDSCDVCNGSGPIYECGCSDIPDTDCDCDGNIYDECGMCGGTGISDGDCDCFGNVDSGCGCGLAGPNECDVCDNSINDLGCGCGQPAPSGCDNSCGSTLVDDCLGVCGGNALFDNCGVCDNDPNNDCDADCNGLFDGDEGYTGAIYDECGVCGGEGAVYECGCENIAENACDCDGNINDDYGVCGGINECQSYDIPINTFTMLNNGQVLYHSLSYIAGIQFSIDFNEYCGNSNICPDIPQNSEINLISEGVIGDLFESGNWSLSYNTEPDNDGVIEIIAFLNNLDYLISPGCGLLMNIDYVGSVNDYINIVWSDPEGTPINISYYETDILSIDMPNQFILKQNYPNPFNPITFIEFEIDQSNHVKLIIYDLKGNQVKKIIDNFLNSDSYKVTWDGKDDNFTDSPSGVYIASLSVDGIISNKKLTLIK